MTVDLHIYLVEAPVNPLVMRFRSRDAAEDTMNSISACATNREMPDGPWIDDEDWAFEFRLKSVFAMVLQDRKV